MAFWSRDLRQTPPRHSNLRFSTSAVTRKPAFAGHERLRYTKAARKQHEPLCALSWQTQLFYGIFFREAREASVFVYCAGRFSCRGHLTQTAGRDGAETTGEGRQIRAISVKLTSLRPSGHGVAAPSQTAEIRPRRRRRVGRGRDAPAAKPSGSPTSEARSLAKQGRKRVRPSREAVARYNGNNSFSSLTRLAERDCSLTTERVG